MIRIWKIYPWYFFILGALLFCGCHSRTEMPAPAEKSAPAASGPIRFEDQYATSGINFRLGHGGRSPLSVIDTLGHCIALIDFDGDGNLDIVMTGVDRVSLYKNIGSGKFQDITSGSGLRQKGYWQGCAVGDFDNDGKPDLYLSARGDAALYRNLGNGRFQEMTPGSGMAVKDPNRWNTACVCIDFDRDGHLDLYVGAYLDVGKNSGLCPFEGEMQACPPRHFTAQKGILYQNLGGWKFKPISLAGVVHGKNLAAIAGDLYGDGGVELYLTNDEEEADMIRYLGHDRWINEGIRGATAVGPDGRVQGGMGIGAGDYDNDGRVDIVVGTFVGEDRSIYHNDGHGLYTNVAHLAGISKAAMPYVAFGTQLVDLDNDGRVDLVMANGHVQDHPQHLNRSATYAQPTQVFHNIGGGRFDDVSATVGPNAVRPIVGRALCTGDLDNDGRVDLVVEDLEGAPLILHNISPAAGNWLRLKLVGTKSCRDGQGAVIICNAGGHKQAKLVTTGGSFFSASDPRVHFGLGMAKSVDSLLVRWATGKTQTLHNITANKEIEIREP